MSIIILKIKREFSVLHASMVFYTRIPLPYVKGDISYAFSAAIRYLPLVGSLVGALGALVYYGTALIFPHNIAVLFSMVGTLFLTGVFHEDGLADTCDGLGGGTERSRKLEIMKDSRLGTYGVTGLVMALLIKYALLSTLEPTLFIVASVAAHTASRYVPLWIARFLPYSRQKEGAKIQETLAPVSVVTLIFGLFCSVWPFFLIRSDAFLLLFLTLPIALFFGLLLKRQIGGYTGDTLGASQQISEIIFYSGIYILCTYTQSVIQL